MPSAWRVADACFAQLAHQYDPIHGGTQGFIFIVEYLIILLGGPKFPTPALYYFLLRYHAFSQFPSAIMNAKSVHDLPLTELTKITSQLNSNIIDLSSNEGRANIFEGIQEKKNNGALALKMVTKTLEKMYKGGIHDIIGHGFHRYSVDDHWYVLLYRISLCTIMLGMFPILKKCFMIKRNCSRYILKHTH